MLPGGARAATPSPRSPRTRGRSGHEVNTVRARRRRARRPRAPRPHRRAVALARRSCATAARAVRGGELARPPTASRGCSPSARRCRRCPAPRAGRRCRSTSRARSRSCFERAPLDICHVHEPFAPSVASAALRHSRALNVGTFHAPDRARRLDAGRAQGRRSSSSAASTRAPASFAATRDAAAALLPRRLPVVAPGADPLPRAARAPTARRSRIAFVDEEERARAAPVPARAAPARRRAAPGSAVVRSARGPSSRRRCAPTCASACASSTDDDRGRLLAGADMLVAASDGAAPAPGLLVARARRRRRPRRLAPAGLRGGRRRRRARAAVRARDAEMLAAQLARLIGDGDLRERLRAAPRGRGRGARVADELEALYARARRAPPRRPRHPRSPRRLASRPLIDVDLHMHTDHSHDCATPVEVLLATARDAGLGAIAVTDHNEVSGALEARGQGRRVRRQGDRRRGGQDRRPGRGDRPLHQGEDPARADARRRRSPRSSARAASSTCPTRSTACTRCPTTSTCSTSSRTSTRSRSSTRAWRSASFNEEAARFAAKYRIPAGAGSDAHVAQGLGSVRVRMRDFDGPEEFLESLRDGGHRHASRRACSTCRR